MKIKTYAITGVSNGIGRELARTLKSDGHRVIGLDIVAPEDELDQFINIDLSDAQSIEIAADAITTSLDGICNCAGLPLVPVLKPKFSPSISLARDCLQISATKNSVKMQAS